MIISLHEAPESTRSQPLAIEDSGEGSDLVGLIPAAGHATRLALTERSKELIDVPDPRRPDPDQRNPVAGYLLRQMARAGCSRAFFVVRPGKWDIADAFGGQSEGMPLAYLSIEDSWGPPFTLATALPFVKEATVTTGFPDILIEPPDALATLVAHLQTSDADVALATFAAEAADGCDHISVAADGKVLAITPKEDGPVWTGNSKTWLLAAWRPRFSAFFNDTLRTFARDMAAAPPDTRKDLPMGSILVRALAAGHLITSVHFPHGRFLDIGTPERLAQAAGFFAQP